MKNVLMTLLAVALTLFSNAKEGMWIPMLVEQLNIDDMRSMGFQLSAEDIYSVNQSSLKDAVVHFGGGCTGEIISDQGLLLTNHHCGYGQIQYHSTVQNDYLKDGFWAMSKDEELPNPGLTATLIVRMEDVTQQVLEGVTDDMAEKDRQALIAENSKNVGEAAIKDTHYEYLVKPFYYGNEYYMFITETFLDVRLVGAPPSSIGKFGFDTDNWVWPRHTGDFSVFRIYAGKDNKPAAYSKENVPYTPKYSFPISLSKMEEGDFTMIYGFPGRTSEYLTSDAVDYVLNKSNPAKISMRDASLAVINEAMTQSDELRIAYAAKQSRISNAHKKWKGQSKGLKRLNAIEKKKAFEQKFVNALAQNPQFEKNYGHLLGEFEKLLAAIEPYKYTRELFIELYYYGPEILRFSGEFKPLIEAQLADSSEAYLQKVAEPLKGRVTSFFKDYDASTDQAIFAALFKQYSQVSSDKVTLRFQETVKEKFDGNYKDYAKWVYRKSTFDDRVDLSAIVHERKKGQLKKLAKDPAYLLVNDMLDQYLEEIKPTYDSLSDKIDELNRTYMEALRAVLPNEKVYYPDANSTLRYSYGKVEGYEPFDGAYYHFYTTLDGVMEKYIPGDREYDVPKKLRELYANKNYGQYDYDGVMPVCFLASNHTTGGNSGSPVLDANGNLKGLNFDRSWESTMSDIMFDPDRCRNIMVDINYVLFIIDKFAGATHLVNEMELVRE